MAEYAEAAAAAQGLAVGAVENVGMARIEVAAGVRHVAEVTVGYTDAEAAIPRLVVRIAFVVAELSTL